MQNVVRLLDDFLATCHVSLSTFRSSFSHSTGLNKKKMHVFALCHVLSYFFLRQSLSRNLMSEPSGLICQSVGRSFGYLGILTLQVQKKFSTPRPWESGLTQESLVCGGNITDPARGLRCLDTDLVSMDPLAGLMIPSPTVDGLRSWYRVCGKTHNCPAPG